MDSPLKHFAQLRDPRVARTREHLLEEILLMVLAAVLSGTVVTIDAMGCQRAIAEKIVGQKADYILAVKENQDHLLEQIKDSFQMLAADAVQTEIDCAHGRVERRRLR